MHSVVRETLSPSPYFEGCNLVFPRDVLERTGGFDESFPFSGEDTAAGWAAAALAIACSVSAFEASATLA